MSLFFKKPPTSTPLSYRFLDSNQHHRSLYTTLTDHKLIFKTDSAIEAGWVIEVTLMPQQLSDVSFTALIEVESSTRISRKHFEINAIIGTIKAQ